MNLTLEDAVKEMMEKLAKRVPAEHKKEPVNLYIAGGIAIYFHTALRVSKDVDAIIDRNIDIPRKLSVLWLNENGEFEELEFDKNYTAIKVRSSGRAETLKLHLDLVLEMFDTT